MALHIVGRSIKIWRIVDDSLNEDSALNKSMARYLDFINLMRENVFTQKHVESKYMCNCKVTFLTGGMVTLITTFY